MLNRGLRYLLPTLLALVLAACTAVQPAPAANIANGIVMQLVLPASELAATQKITASYQASQHILIMQVEASPQRIAMAGLTPTGTRLFSLAFDGQTLDSWQSPLFRAPFDAAYVLADFELATLPLALLRQALPAGAALTDTVHGATRSRSLRNRAGATVIHIEYEGNITRYCHRERGYCLLIETL